MQKLVISFIVFSVAIPFSVSAHPGKLNASGCHNNRRTGDYHCHGGSGGGRGYVSPPQPVCSDEQSLQIAISIFKGDPQAGGENLWRSSNDVLISKGAAKLNGESGDLYIYDVQELRIKNFVSRDGGINAYSFDGSPWIRVLRQVKQGDTLISSLEPNNLEINKVHYIENFSTQRICR